MEFLFVYFFGSGSESETGPDIYGLVVGNPSQQNGLHKEYLHGKQPLLLISINLKPLKPATVA